MPVVWREADFDVGFLLHDIYSTEHDALHEAVHGKVFHFSTLEERVLHPVGHDEINTGFLVRNSFRKRKKAFSLGQLKFLKYLCT